MAGLVFPDIAGSVLPFIQMDRQDQQDRLTRERQSRLDERQLRMDELTLQDRKDQRALQQMQVLQSMDDKQRAKMKEAADWQGYAAHAVLSAPPETRQQVYTTMLGEAKNRGFNLSGLPQQYTPALDGQLEFYRRQAHGIAEMLTKQDADRPQPLGPVGGGPATPAPNQQQFVETMTPHALEIAKATGLDPRLVLAQSILETGYGVRAPGNNYFGIKGPGQMLATTEAGPGSALVPTQDSFRTYASPGASAQDYISFIKGNQGRYAPVMAAQGLDAQIDAMGKSGYATDPNYAAKLRAIAQSLPPIGAPPTPAPQPGFLPTNVPAQSVPGALPQVAQGDAIAGQGDVMAPPRAPLQGTSGAPVDPDIMRQIQLPPGARFVQRHGKVSQPQPDTFEIMYPDGRLGVVRAPPKKEDGMFGSGENSRALEHLVNQGILTKDQAATIAAGKVITNPADGTIMFAPPQLLAGAGGPGAPGASPNTPPGAISLTPPKPQVTPKEQAELRSLRVEAKRISSAAEDFLSEWNKASSTDRLRSVVGANTPLNAAYTNLALLAKGDALFKLGVLNGPDLSIIRRALADPSTFASMMTSNDEVAQSVQKVVRLMATGIKATEDEIEGAGGKVDRPAPPPTSVGGETPKVRTFNPQKGTLE